MRKMDAKGRKMLALGIVTMLCAVAIIGIGYAAFAGNARTYNQGNAVDTGYMTLSPDGGSAAVRWAAISAEGSEAFSTYTYVTVGGTQQEPTYTEGMAYYFASGGDDGSGAAQNYTVKQIGVAKSFTVVNQSSETITYVDFTATAVNGTNGNLAAITASDFKYFLKVTIDGGSAIYLDVSGSGDSTGATAITFDENTHDATITVAICIGYIADVYIPTSFVGPATQEVTANPAIETASGPVDMTDIDFAFLVEAADAP